MKRAILWCLAIGFIVAAFAADADARGRRKIIRRGGGCSNGICRR